MQKNTSQVGIIGLAAMGANLARNITDKKIKVAVYNRTKKKTDAFLKEYGNEHIKGVKTLKELIDSLEKPRKIFLMIKSGQAIDDVIESLIPLLNKNDIIIDLGNSNYHDTESRQSYLKERSIDLIGCGISGGEEGALNGPSLMPGGSKKAWNHLEPIFKPIAALDFKGKPCVTYLGEGGSGHFVKTVHNGIEYAIMASIAEAYDILKTMFAMPAPQIGQIFHRFNQSKLNSFLFETAAAVLQKRDDIGSGYLINKILDKASQKGTGMWTVEEAMQHAVSAPTISEAVMSRIISGNKEKRMRISGFYKKQLKKENLDLDKFIHILDDALYSTMIISFAQGLDLIQTVSRDNKWNISIPEVLRIWQGGCIIRSKLLEKLEHCFKDISKNDSHTFELPESRSYLKGNIGNLRKVTLVAMRNQLPIPVLSSALNYFDGMTQEESNANMIQAMRDAFGAHTFERKDTTGVYHSQWNNK